MVRTSEYVLAYICIDGDKPTTARFLAEIHLVGDLSANLLIGVDVIAPQATVLDFEKHTVRIGSCEVVAPISVITSRDAHIKRTVRAKKALTIPSGALTEVPIVENPFGISACFLIIS